MSQSNPDVAEDADETERRLRRLEDLVEQQAETIDHLEGEVEALEGEVEDLEADLAAERETRQALIRAPNADADNAPLGAVFITGEPVGMRLESALDRQDEFEREFDAVRDELQTEQQTRGQEEAKLRRRMAAIAEKAGVDVTDADLLGDDKIQRVLKHGVDDVEENPTITAYRARELLVNIASWGQTITDANGRRIAIKSPAAQARFEDARDEDLATSQIKRVFRKVEEWGSSSPRHVDADFGGDTNRLVVSLEETNR